MKPQIQWSYLFKHWFATLLIAPFLCDLFLYVDSFNEKIGGLIEVYPVVFIVSLIGSVPTYAVYALAFYFLKKEDASVILSKRILITISVTGIFITFTLGFPMTFFPAALAYMLTSLLTGIFFKLEKLPAEG